MPSTVSNYCVIQTLITMYVYNRVWELICKDGRFCISSSLMGFANCTWMQGWGHVTVSHWGQAQGWCQYTVIRMACASLILKVQQFKHEYLKCQTKVSILDQSTNISPSLACYLVSHSTLFHDNTVQCHWQYHDTGWSKAKMSKILDSAQLLDC